MKNEVPDMTNNQTGEELFIVLLRERSYAQMAGDSAKVAALTEKIQQLEDEYWQVTCTIFPELATSVSIAQAVIQRAQAFGYTVLANIDAIPAESKHASRFIFGLAIHKRSVRLWPIDERNHYDITLFHQAPSRLTYRGVTPHFDDAVRVVCDWLAGQSIERINTYYSWMSKTPWRTAEPRLTFRSHEG
jgi:hypothetical protein